MDASIIKNNITFNEMDVNGLLTNAKKQHRLLVKPKHGGSIIGPGKTNTDAVEKINYATKAFNESSIHRFLIECPYKIGQEILIREKWFCEKANSESEKGYLVTYLADGEKRFFNQSKIPENWISPSPTKSGDTITAVKMPAFFVRLSIKITNIRLERLCDITDEDAIKEGIEPINTESSSKFYDFTKNDGSTVSSAKESILGLWLEKRGFITILKNPYVWVIEFDNKEI